MKNEKENPRNKHGKTILNNIKVSSISKYMQNPEPIKEKKNDNNLTI